ncbi:MAG: hypothetical protein QXV71_00410 [Candidatus Bathyarchaeia archaeon]
MIMDFLMPSILLIIVALALLLHKRVESRMRRILEDRKLSVREIILMVTLMGIMVSVATLIPEYAIQILFIAAYSYMLLVFTYIFSGRLALSILPPSIFIITYLMTDSILVTNIFAAIFAIMIITYLNSLFSLRVALIFSALLIVMDIVQVFFTGHMVGAAIKMLSLRLPVAIVLPGISVLGLGDIFLSGLLSTQAASRYGRKVGLLTAATISLAFFIFEFLMLNFGLGAGGFPATVIVLLGWLLGIGIYTLQRRGSK